MLAAAILEAREEARQEATRHQLPSERPLSERLKERRPPLQPRVMGTARMQPPVAVRRPMMPVQQEAIEVIEQGLTPAEHARISELVKQKMKESFKEPTAEGISPFYVGE